MKNQTCLIFCKCGAGIIPDDKQNQFSKVFRKMNIDVFELHDLCAFSLNEKEFLNTLNSTYKKKFVVACYPRAIKNMFRQNKIEIDNFEVLNFREFSVEQIQQKLNEGLEENPAGGNYVVKETSLEVPAWYPVIDDSRCTLCGQCARFCVFGVYKFDKKSLQVKSPLSCKNHCPACGRTCPASAIMFPRLPENSSLSGAKPGENQKCTTGVAQKDGLFVLLNERNNARRNIFRHDVMQLAKDERQKAIDELKKRAKE